MVFPSVSTTASTPQDPRTALTAELTSLQILIWLLEARQNDVRLQLEHCRARRSGLGRAYRRLLASTRAGAC